MTRKIYFATMVQPSVAAPEGFEERYDAYWNAVDQQVSQLETKSGRVARIFVEGVLGEGDEAMLLVQQSNPGAYKVLRERVSAGTVFEMFEDTNLFGKVVDWGRCLHIGLINGEVADEIQTKYDEASEKRRAHLQRRLEEGILESESALVFGDDQNIKLPEGTEKILISPPERDELERWVQQTNRSIEEQVAQDGNWADSDRVTTPPGV